MSALLEVEGLVAGYGDLPVLHGVSMTVTEGEVVSVVGANGAGKTSLLGAISGIVDVFEGSIRFAGDEVATAGPDAIVGEGVVLVPEGRRLFPFLTVQENLELGAYHRAARRDRAARLAEVLELFPILADRREQKAGTLSGGEQQMCAIARGLMRGPDLLMLDEPSLGLAPVIVEQVFDLIERLRKTRLTVLLVEQNVSDCLSLSDRAYVLEQGRIVMSGPGPEMLERPELQRAYLGL